MPKMENNVLEMKATIVTIGDEILIGQILDTNSQYISKALNSIGVAVAERTSIGDDAEGIVSTLDRALANSEIVILTGGLGPTKDDLTKHTLARRFGCGMHYDARVGEHVRTMLACRGIEFIELNRQQAMVPDACEVLWNAHGTAPGMLFRDGDRTVISLPGVPFEMQHLVDDEVLPRLKRMYSLSSIVHRTMITSGIAESILAERIAAWEEALPEYLHLAYLPAPNIVRLRLSAYEVDGVEAGREIEEQFGRLREIIPENVVGFEGASVEAQVHDFLTSHHMTLAVAESCTGGRIASLFTAQAGASAYFRAGVTAYTCGMKCSILGVDPELIGREGVVSEAVARAMAEGVRRISGSDFSIATTGIAGPSGGTEAQPVGTVWMAVATADHTVAECRNCGTDRGQVISRASAYAVAMLRRELESLD